MTTLLYIVCTLWMAIVVAVNLALLDILSRKRAEGPVTFLRGNVISTVLMFLALTYIYMQT